MSRLRELKRALRGILVREVEKIWNILLKYEERLRNELIFTLIVKGVPQYDLNYIAELLLLGQE